MEQKLLRRQTIVPPDPGSLPAALVTRLARASSSLAELAPVSPQRIVHAPATLVAPLRHPLSDAYLERNGPAEAPIRADIESAALDMLGSSLDTADPAVFARALASANDHVTGGGGGWRQGHVGTAPDMCGNSIVFPPRARAGDQIDRLRKLLGRADIPAIFTAAMALALLTNCHPFRDGNGRVARLIFNHALRRGGMPPDVYIAFSELAGRSDGGYLIALRQGELRGQWEPFLEFVMTIIGVHRSLAQWDGRIADVA